MFAPTLPPATNAPVAPTAIDWHLGSLMVWHLETGQTDGVLSLGEVVVRQGGEPPLHIHAREDETWYVLEGTVLFQRGQERLTLGVGDAIFLPRGLAHGFAIVTQTARMLHVYTPGGLEGAHRAVSVAAPARELPPAPDGPPTAEQIAEVERVYGEHGVAFVGPPLALDR